MKEIANERVEYVLHFKRLNALNILTRIAATSPTWNVFLEDVLLLLEDLRQTDEGNSDVLAISFVVDRFRYQGEPQPVQVGTRNVK